MEISYNCFKDGPPRLSQTWSPVNPNRINFNSIYGVSSDISSQVLRIIAGKDNIFDIDATQNYWDGLTEQDIEKLILDKNDDISIDKEVKFLPMLTEPHPDTPTCGN